MGQVENQLNEDCNLILAGTHKVYVRPEDGVVFVEDKELSYMFGVPNAMTRAKDTAEESNEADVGCSTCPIRHICKPEPVALKKSNELILIPAQRTAFSETA